MCKLCAKVNYVSLWKKKIKLINKKNVQQILIFKYKETINTFFQLQVFSPAQRPIQIKTENLYLYKKRFHTKLTLDLYLYIVNQTILLLSTNYIPNELTSKFEKNGTVTYSDETSSKQTHRVSFKITKI